MIESIQFIDAELPWFVPVFVFLFGTCIGSFLNVCIYRIPAGLSIVHPGSRCGSCGTPIAWYDNIPVLGWLVLRGKARCCGASFSFRYPAIELLTGVLFVLSWKVFTPSVAFIVMFYCALMVVITFIDLDHFIIPDRFSVGGMVLGLVLSFFFPALQGVSDNVLFAGMQSLFYSVIGAFFASAMIYWIMTIAGIVLRKEAMGEGDVKLMGAIGAFIGWKGSIFALFGGSMIGCCALLAFKLTALLLNKSEESSEAKQQIKDELDIPENGVPFGPMLAVGSLVYLFLMKDSFDQAINLFISSVYQ